MPTKKTKPNPKAKPKKKSTFDFAPTEAALLDASRAAFAKFFDDYPDHRFYGMGLFTGPEFSYVAPTAMSEEGLAQSAANHRNRRGKASSTARELRASLRWSAADSPHHDEIDFEGVDMSGVAATLHAIDVRRERAKFDAFVAEIHEMFYRVLKQLDDEGAFGTGRAREKLFVSMMMGDRDRSVLELGKRLNPPAAFERYREQTGL